MANPEGRGASEWETGGNLARPITHTAVGIPSSWGEGCPSPLGIGRAPLT